MEVTLTINVLPNEHALEIVTGEQFRVEIGQWQKSTIISLK